MKVKNFYRSSFWGLLALLTASFQLQPANARINSIEITQRSAETQVRRLLEPLLDKYCRDECKLLSVSATVDYAIADEIAPGFEDVSREPTLAPSSARVRLLINQKVGPVSRGKLLDLIQQYLDTLDYPVKIDTQFVRFPEPIEASTKVAELRERVTKQFRSSIEGLFEQFCPGHCLLADYNLQTEPVNGEEAEYGSPGEFFQDGGVAIRVKDVSATILVDEDLPPIERTNILEMARLKTNFFKNVSLSAKAMKFPRPGPALAAAAAGLPAGSYAGQPGGPAGAPTSTIERSIASQTDNQNSFTTTNSNTNAATNTTNESNMRSERFERFEKIERVEDGDAVQAELQKFKVFGLIFSCSILSLLIFLALATHKPKHAAGPTVHKIIQSLASDPVSTSAPSTYRGSADTIPTGDDRATLLGRRLEAEALLDELTRIFVQQPKVAKHVFTRILTEEGVEVTAQYMHMFGESIITDMLRDPSLQSDLSELMEYYAKTPIELKDEEKLELLRILHNRTVAGKLVVMGNRSSNLFDFLGEMDGTQILELIRNESLTVKSIVLTQVDPQKRAVVYAQIDDDTRLKLLTELSRIDYLPRDYIFNVSNALKRKRRENPKLNTEALPGSEVLVSLLERTGTHMQRTVIKSLEGANPESARTIKSKLVSIDTLRYLRDGQLLEVILSLRHDELLQFLKGATDNVRMTIFSKAPRELAEELEEELAAVGAVSREMYQAVERKVLNRMKLMANEGLINLIETNERMFSDNAPEPGFVQGMPAPEASTQTNLKKVSGW